MSACEGAVKITNNKQKDSMNHFNLVNEDFVISYLVPVAHHKFLRHFLSSTEPFVHHLSRFEQGSHPMPKTAHEMPLMFPPSQLLPFQTFVEGWKLEKRKRMVNVGTNKNL